MSVGWHLQRMWAWCRFAPRGFRVRSGLFGLRFAAYAPGWGRTLGEELESGWYEHEELGLILGTVGPGAQVVEVGGGVGYTACHLSRLIGSAGRLVVVEPSTANVATIRRNLRLNRCANATVVHAGVRLGAQADIQSAAVPTVSVRSVCEREGLDPTHVVLDCEGGEDAVFREEARWLAERGCSIVAELHPAFLGCSAGRIVAPLREMGFVVLEVSAPERGSVIALAMPPEGRRASIPIGVGEA